MSEFNFRDELGSRLKDYILLPFPPSPPKEDTALLQRARCSSRTNDSSHEIKLLPFFSLILVSSVSKLCSNARSIVDSRFWLAGTLIDVLYKFNSRQFAFPFGLQDQCSKVAERINISSPLLFDRVYALFFSLFLKNFLKSYL